MISLAWGLGLRQTKHDKYRIRTWSDQYCHIQDHMFPRCCSIHSRYKADVAARLVRGALGVAYGREGVVFAGPLPLSYSVADRQLVLTFNASAIDVRSNTGFEVSSSIPHPRSRRLTSLSPTHWGVVCIYRCCVISLIMISLLCSYINLFHWGCVTCNASLQVVFSIMYVVSDCRLDLCVPLILVWLCVQLCWCTHPLCTALSCVCTDLLRPLPQLVLPAVLHEGELRPGPRVAACPYPPAPRGAHPSAPPRPPGAVDGGVWPLRGGPAVRVARDALSAAALRRLRDGGRGRPADGALHLYPAGGRRGGEMAEHRPGEHPLDTLATHTPWDVRCCGWSTLYL